MGPMTIELTAFECFNKYGSGYIHDCRNSSDTKRLFSRQPFPIPKSLYTRLPCIQYKIVIYTAAVSHIKLFIYTAAGHPVSRRYLHGSRFPFQKLYIHGCRATSIKSLFTRQPFLMSEGLNKRLPCIHDKIVIYPAAVPHTKTNACK